MRSDGAKEVVGVGGGELEGCVGARDLESDPVCEIGRGLEFVVAVWAVEDDSIGGNSEGGRHEAIGCVIEVCFCDRIVGTDEQPRGCKCCVFERLEWSLLDLPIEAVGREEEFAIDGGGDEEV